MTTSQLLIYGLAALILAFYVRRAILSRSIRQYSPAQLQARLQSPPPPILLDVRTESEHRSGALKGSVHIPVQELRRRADELAKQRDREIICYCQTGNRSTSAALMLKRLGHTVGNLKGGMAEWNFSHLAGSKL
jgi:rhodanese-related sulfurtransferase